MDKWLRTIERERGVFLRSEVRGLGYDDKAVRRAVRRKLWWRVRHGAYCFFDTWERADPVQRHLILARAVMRSMEGRVVLSHVSALVAHGVAVWGADLRRVHVTRIDGGAGRVERDVVHHTGRLLPLEPVEVMGMQASPPDRAAVEAATVMPVEPALVSMDSVLRKGLAASDQLAERYRQLEHWPGAQKLQLVMRLADGRADSPGETRSRYLCWSQNLPAPDLQCTVHDETGTLVGTTDFVWHEHGVLGEFDGKVKYGRLLRPDQDPGDAVFAEKRREDRLREVTGYRMFRLVWSDLQRPVETGRRLADYLRRIA
ncbi:MAG TPA: type IV toxin-antitoxin system AbiEi family antitoxin domain-containing protein [Nocardioidaceae bacterium]